MKLPFIGLRLIDFGMIPDLDIYRSANVLVKQHGQNVPIEAAMRADELLEMGDVEGCLWGVRSSAIVIHPIGLGRVSTSSLKGGR